MRRDVLEQRRTALLPAVFALLAVSVLHSSATAQAVGTAPTDTILWARYYASSLHATAGMATWYQKSNGGFESFTGVPYGDLSCKTCHEPRSTGGCASCHGTATPAPGAKVDASLTGVCGHCHSRQVAEAAHYSDVHRDAGMNCMQCHSREDVMGDGTSYSSMLERGAIDAKCESCHATLTENEAHRVHQKNVDCTACHMQSVVSCYNCHFETQLQLDKKVAYGQLRDWVFLVNRNGKVHAANFQSVKYGDHTFVALAPFYAHTIGKSARTCADCHDNGAVRDYAGHGVIQVATWDSASGKLKHATGVVPVPPDYQKALRFDFVDLDRPGGTAWSFLKSGADRMQILFAEPLTAEQMKAMLHAQPGTEHR
jgi:predicted CXXCH cytochrome family protein